MKFPKEVIENTINEESDESYGTVLVESSGWEVDGKYQSREYIFSYLSKFYSVCEYRTGSPYSDYCYDEFPDEVDCPEVKQVEVIKKEWRVVPNEMV